MEYIGQGWEGDATGDDVAQATAAYRYLLHVYQSRGYLTLSETNYANHISQIMTELQNQRMKVDQDLANEMLKHLVKMKAK